jgi:hypothetical protein
MDIRGVWGSDYSHLFKALRVMERHQNRVPWRELAGNVYPLSKAGEALVDIQEQRCAKAILQPGKK